MSEGPGLRRRVHGGLQVLLAAIVIAGAAGCVHVPNAKPEFSTRAVLIETGPDFGDAAYARQLAVVSTPTETSPQR